MALPGDVATFVKTALPPPPARVLEVGAGAGELAAELAAAGYEVTAIDPAGQWPNVRRVALHELEAPPFDAAVAVLSLHHVEPLEPSCRRLGALVRPGGMLVIDEFDVEALDERAARWWLARRGDDGRTPRELVHDLREHLHALRRLRAALAPWFALPEPVRGPYLYRWDLGEHVRAEEEAAIARGALPATGARMVGQRPSRSQSEKSLQVPPAR